MTLQQFLSLTSATPPAVVRHAMVVALAMEPPARVMPVPASTAGWFSRLGWRPSLVAATPESTAPASPP